MTGNRTHCTDLRMHDHNTAALLSEFLHNPVGSSASSTPPSKITCYKRGMMAADEGIARRKDGRGVLGRGEVKPPNIFRKVATKTFQKIGMT